MMPIWKKSVLSLLVTGLSAVLLGVGPAQTQVSLVWTETSEEDFATGLGLDTVNVDIRTSSGDILLAEANENFALNKSAEDDDNRNDNYPDRLVDGEILTYWSSQTPHCLGVNLIVDLKAQRLIERINIMGGPINPQLFRIRGYQISVSSDKSNWTQVAENSNNLDKDVFETIEPIVTRYVRVTISVINQVNWVVIGDIQIFGAGYASQGSYYSEAKDFGTVTNFGKASWVAELPDQDMGITLQFRSDSVQVLNDGGILEDTLALTHNRLVPGTEVVTDEAELLLYNRGVDYDIDYQRGVLWRLATSTIDSAALIMVDYSLWGAWSQEYSNPEGELFLVAEPRRYLQYRANLSTNTTNTPSLKEISIAHSPTPVAHKALGFVVPNEVPIMKASSVTYMLQFNFGHNDLGVDTVVVSTPSPARSGQVRLDGSPLSGADYDDLSNRERIKIAFTQPILTESEATLEIDFNTTLFFSENKYPSHIVSSGTPDNPQLVEQAESTWTINTIGIPAGPLVSVQAKPNPFSPNGDGLFDETIISYFVAKIAYPQPVSIKIYDLNGDKIRTLHDQRDPAFFYEIPWDGRDDSGHLVAPGVYIYQVRVTTDAGEEVATKTITVQY